MDISADMAMVARKSRPGWTNLAIGEPVFLQRCMSHLYPSFVSVHAKGHQYPDSTGDGDLRKAVCANEPTLAGFKPEQVVITNGAKQALIATMYAFNKVDNRLLAWAPAPYWPSLPTLAKNAGLHWGESDAHDVQIAVWPNNPSGNDENLFKIFTRPEEGRLRIWDAVYASYVYDGHFPCNFDYDAIVGSASKSYGLSGLRIGWVAFKDTRFVEAAGHYVETTTSGVSIAAQTYLLSFYRRANEFLHDYHYCLDKAKEVLKTNGDLFKDSLGKYFAYRGVAAGDGGMFTWFKPTIPINVFRNILDEAKVELVDGEHCGVYGWFRMNMGVETQDIEKALFRIRECIRVK